MNYRDKFYLKYVSTQTSRLYGEASLDEIEKQFPVWRKYFGRFLPKDKNAQILDFGCGNGSFVYWLQELGYKNVVGTEISKEQVELSQKLGIKNIFQGDEILKNKKDFYDVIFMRDVIEHFTKEEVLSILELIYKSLKSGGVLIIQTTNAESPFSSRLRYGDFTHEISFTQDSIRQILLASSFKDISVCPVPRVIHGFKSLIRAVLWKIIEFCLHLYFIIETGGSKMIFTQDIIAVAKK